MKYFKVLMATALFPISLWAHGEDKLGPNGGYIRMPGGFHTEVKISDNNLLIYLLDINWKNPVTEKSSIDVEYSQTGNISKLSCDPRDKYFSCKLPKDFNPNLGQFFVQADRMGMKGKKAEYPLPLKLISQMNDHSKH